MGSGRGGEQGTDARVTRERWDYRVLQQAAAGEGLREMMVGRQERADGRWRGKTLSQPTNTPLL